MSPPKLAIVSRVRHRQRAPVAGDRGVEVHQVVAVEDDLLGVDLGPAHAQALEETEVGTLHGRSAVVLGALDGAPQCARLSRMALINYITQVQFDFGALALLPQECERAGITQAAGRHRRRRARRRLLDRALAALGGLPHAVFDATPSNPTEARRARRGRRLPRRTAATAWSRSAAARASTSPRASPSPPPTTARSRPTPPSKAAARSITERVAPLIAVPDHRRHRQRGGARRDRHRRRRPEARLPQLAPGAQDRDLRPRADARPAAVPHRRDRHGRDRALHGDLHGAGRQSARRRHRASTASSAPGRTSSARPATAATARRAST